MKAAQTHEWLFSVLSVVWVTVSLFCSSSEERAWVEQVCRRQTGCMTSITAHFLSLYFFISSFLFPSFFLPPSILPSLISFLPSFFFFLIFFLPSFFVFPLFFSFLSFLPSFLYVILFLPSFSPSSFLLQCPSFLHPSLNSFLPFTFLHLSFLLSPLSSF